MTLRDLLLRVTLLATVVLGTALTGSRGQDCSILGPLCFDTGCSDNGGYCKYNQTGCYCLYKAGPKGLTSPIDLGR